LELNQKYSKIRHLIWLATMWSLQRVRNNIMFRVEVVDLSSLVDQIICISQFWFIRRIENTSHLVFSDWCDAPLACLQII
jgi:hypothetical protein